MRAKRKQPPECECAPGVAKRCRCDYAAPVGSTLRSTWSHAAQRLYGAA